jgi:hypothetical protein
MKQDNSKWKCFLGYSRAAGSPCSVRNSNRSLRSQFGVHVLAMQRALRAIRSVNCTFRYMARITIYLRDDLAAKARKAAKAMREPVSRWIAAQIERSVGETWPQAVLDAAGALPDFPELSELRKAMEGTLAATPYHGVLQDRGSEADGLDPNPSVEAKL